IIALLNVTDDGQNMLEVSVDSNFPDALAARAADIDGDGDLDVVAVGGNHDVAWWENLNGTGQQWSPITLIDDFFPVAFSVDAVDVDKDGDLDVIAGGNNLLTAWWENLDGKGDVWSTLRPIGNVAAFPGNTYIKGQDLDGDGDLDFLVTTNQFNGSYTSAWIEDNGAASPSAYPTHILNSSEVGYYSNIVAADTNHDGLLEVFTTRETENPPFLSPAFNKWEITKFKRDGWLASSFITGTNLDTKSLNFSVDVPQGTQFYLFVRSADATGTLSAFSYVPSSGNTLSNFGVTPSDVYLEYGIYAVSDQNAQSSPRLDEVTIQ
ncbi:MAG: VCBS repeat-containing protein, partial [Bdellovibrionales bacterium]|nr:VCBS repeat-containing protein [Bdellovibrionales bacterium]